MHGHIERRPRSGGGYSYRATFVIARHADGTIDRRRETFDTEREAQEALARWVVARADGTLVGTNRQTFGEFLNHWLSVSKRNRIEDSTYASYADMISGHIVPGLGAIPLQDLKATDIERFLAAKAVGGRLDGRAGGLSDRMLIYLYTIIRGALGHAVRLRLVPFNQATLIDPPRKRGAKPELTTWTDEELDCFLAAAEANRWHPLWHIALLTGMRRQELLGLRWRDLHLDQGWLKISQCVVLIHSRIVIKQPKNSTSRRTLHLDPAAVQLLVAHRTAQKAHKMRTRRIWEEHDLVFPSLRGTPLDPANLGILLDNLIAVAGVSRVTFHGLRHLSASYGLASGVDQLTLSRRLGHSRPSTTTDIYGQLVPGADAGAASTIADRILGQKEGIRTRLG